MTDMLKLERAGNYLKMLAGVPYETKAQSEKDATGSNLVPEDMAAVIIPLREYYGTFRKNAQLVQMRRDTVNVPRRTGSATVAWKDEGSAPADSSAAFDQVGLIAKKLIVLIKVSTELLEDSAPDLAQFVAEEAAYLLAQEEDVAGFTGTGTSAHGGFTGVVGHLQSDGTGGKFTATGHTTIGAITNGDIAAMIGTLPAFAMPKAAWYANPYTIGNCFGALAAAAGGDMRTGDDPTQITFVGFPVHRTVALKGSGATTGDMPIVFGDLGQAAILGQRRELGVDVSWHRLFDADQVMFRITERVAINVHALNSASTAGPVVGLQLG